MRLWMLSSTLESEDLATVLGEPQTTTDRAVVGQYELEGHCNNFTVSWQKPLMWNSTLLGNIERSHDISTSVLFDHLEVPAGNVHASLTADLIEHPEVFAGVFCDPDLMAFVVWSETVEMVRPLVERDGASPEFVSYVQPFVDRHLASVSVPLEAELIKRGIGYTWRDVPLTEI